MISKRVLVLLVVVMKVACGDEFPPEVGNAAKFAPGAVRRVGMYETYFSNSVEEIIGKACKTNGGDLSLDELISCYWDNGQIMEILKDGPVVGKCAKQLASEAHGGPSAPTTFKAGSKKELRELICNHWSHFDHLSYCAFLEAMKQPARAGKKLPDSLDKLNSCFLDELKGRTDKATDTLYKELVSKACKDNGKQLETILSCLANHAPFNEALEGEAGAGCFMETYKLAYRKSDTNTLKSVVCNMLEKFETVSDCLFERKTGSPEEVDAAVRGFNEARRCFILDS